MTNSAQLQAKKVSLFLSLFVIAFTIVGCYLFLNSSNQFDEIFNSNNIGFDSINPRLRSA